MRPCADYSALNGALKQSLITETDINAALRRVLTQRMRLGDFDPVQLQPWAGIPIVSKVAA